VGFETKDDVLRKKVTALGNQTLAMTGEWLPGDSHLFHQTDAVCAKSQNPERFGSPRRSTYWAHSRLTDRLGL
jgi:hypothetical protein